MGRVQKGPISIQNFSLNSPTSTVLCLPGPGRHKACDRAALMVITSCSDTEAIDRLKGDSLIEKVSIDKKQYEPFSWKPGFLSRICFSPHQFANAALTAKTPGRGHFRPFPTDSLLREEGGSLCLHRGQRAFISLQLESLFSKSLNQCYEWTSEQNINPNCYLVDPPD